MISHVREEVGVGWGGVINRVREEAGLSDNSMWETGRGGQP